jgi:lysophospholipase L1-like esterase
LARFALLVAVVVAAGLAIATQPDDAGAHRGEKARSLLVVCDSLTVGTRPYIHRYLRGWRVTQRVAISTQAAEGPGIMARYGHRLPRVVFVNLGTNGSPGAVGYFQSAVRRVMRRAGPRRCVVWATIKRPPVGGVSYHHLNSVLVAQAKRRRNLILYPWLRVARAHPSWFSGDGVHVTATAYNVRAREMAAKIKKCRHIARRFDRRHRHHRHTSQ